MGSLDISEVLIILGTVAYIAWAIYVFAHRESGVHKAHK